MTRALTRAVLSVAVLSLVPSLLLKEVPALAFSLPASTRHCHRTLRSAGSYLRFSTAMTQPSVTHRRRSTGAGDGGRPGRSASSSSSSTAGDTYGVGGSDSPPVFVETYDGLHKHRVGWDAEHKRFSMVTEAQHWVGFRTRTGRFLRQSFLPENVTPDYYIYTKWRILQRLVSATVSVFGTRALLLALGVKTERVGLAATFNWIQKDAFGKFGRIMWASKMGRRFDSDAKRWRFRSSLLFAAGTGLEVLTYVFPAAFLLLATVANTLKQMSMLTSSATRNAMYKSFAGESQNLGDITAKGEAQIAVVDLVGILLGISLSKMIGTARVGMAAAYIGLSCVDVFAIYHEIRSVVFNTLNLERAAYVVPAYVKEGADKLPDPYTISRRERIFLAPHSINPRIFRTVSQTGCSMEELHRAREVFGAERFMLTHSPSVGTSIVLHTDAKDADVLLALLVWEYFKVAQRGLQPAPPPSPVGSNVPPSPSYSGPHHDEPPIGQAQVLSMMREALRMARSNESGLSEALLSKGWDVKHLVFGKIKRRTDW